MMLFAFAFLFLKYAPFLVSSVVPVHQFAEPGEILKEFEAEQHKLSHHDEQKRMEEEKASADLIAQLQQVFLIIVFVIR